MIGRAALLVLAVGLTTLALPAPAAAAVADQASKVVPDGGGQVLVLLRLAPAHARPGADYVGGYGNGGSRAARRRFAQALARRHGLTVVDDWPMPFLSLDCFVLDVPPGRSPADVSATLAAVGGVEWAQPVNRFEALGGQSAGADPLFRAQPAAVEWHLADLHRLADGHGVRVAIIDSQVDARHPDLNGQVQLSGNFVANRPPRPEQHGTAVAGIIAARSNNGVGIAGVAPRSRLLALRACWQQGTVPDRTVCDTFSLAKALYFAVDKNVDVINLSLGGPSDPLLSRLVDRAIARGIVIVAAVDTARPGGGFPASHPGVVAVSDAPARVAGRMAYVAPGKGIPTTQAGGQWSIVDGSSFSAAHVSGLFALLHHRRSARSRTAALIPRVAIGGAIDSCASLLRAMGGGVCPRPR